MIKKLISILAICILLSTSVSALFTGSMSILDASALQNVTLYINITNKDWFFDTYCPSGLDNKFHFYFNHSSYKNVSINLEHLDEVVDIYTTEGEKFIFGDTV